MSSTSGESVVLYTVADKIARVTMNRPGAMNAMSVGLVTGLRQAMERAQADPDVSVIVLSGVGGNFCVGDDLKEAEHITAETFQVVIMDL
ncbi:MAG TPA: enoyl-CoA hydratase/isomerase family protein, partial [Ktedonobacterales bacterium]|nr:enoyl-CoA hydratase/isomerase family protein [Ktedonobacterales bacterium]